eukprot:TCONS_00056884-protein
MRGSKMTLDADSSCKIRLLDDVELSYEFKKETKGHELFSFVCEQLSLLEIDYFGLRYVDANKQRHWLDPSKEIIKQLKECRPQYMFFFRVKFYPTDPTKLREEITRYQLYLQLKRDILHGRLLCPFNNITDLAAHIVQAELGDFDEDEHGTTYLSGIKLLPRQNEKLEEKIIEYHKSLVGYNPAEAERRFLNLARSQDLYGVDPHPCKDHEDFPLYLGLTPQGIQIIREARRVFGIGWTEVSKVSYENKHFYIQVVSEKKKKNYAFRLTDTPACKHLWKCAVEHMTFYSEEPVKTQVPRRSALSPQNIFRRSKYKFSGKTESELKNESENIRRTTPPTIQRKSSLRLSIQANNRKSCISMPDLEQIQAKFRNTPKDERNGTGNRVENGGDSERSSNSSASKLNGEKEDELAEFETKEFPSSDHESARNSQIFDNVSTSSSQDASSTGSSSQQPIVNMSPPVIQVENVESVTEDQTETRPDFDHVDSPVVQSQQKQNIECIKQTVPPATLSATLNNLTGGNQALLWVMLVLVILPIAYFIQLSLTSKS